MDENQRIKLIAQKLKLDVPIMKMVEQDGKLILYLYGGGLIELIEKGDSIEDEVFSSVPSNSRGSRKAAGVPKSELQRQKRVTN